MRNNSMTTTTAETTTSTQPSLLFVTCTSSSATQLHSNSNNNSMASTASGYNIRRISSVEDDAAAADDDDDARLNSGNSIGSGVRFHSFRDALHRDGSNNNNIGNSIAAPAISTSQLWSSSKNNSNNNKPEDIIFRTSSSNNYFDRKEEEEEELGELTQQSRNESSQRSSYPDQLRGRGGNSDDDDPLTLFLLSQDTNRRIIGGGASDLPLSLEDDSLDERISLSCHQGHHGGASGGSFDHNDNPETSAVTAAASIFGSHANTSTNTDIFRRHPPPTTRLYSPVIGTPTRASFVGGRKRLDTDWTMFRASNSSSSNNDHPILGSNRINHDNNDALFAPSEASSWIPSIRPSLSCPTSVFESPLFSSSLNLASVGSHHSLFGIGVGAGGGSSSAGGGKRSLAADTLLLSQPYRLEKIESVSAGEPSPSHHALDNSGDFLRDGDGTSDDDDDDEDDIVTSSADKDSRLATNELENVDVSVIECDDDDDNDGDSPHRHAAKSNATQPSTTTTNNHNQQQQQQHHLLANHIIQGGPTMVVNANPMRNLTDAFESLVVDHNNNYIYSGGNFGQENRQFLNNDHNLSAQMQSQFDDTSSQIRATATLSSLPQQLQTTNVGATTCHYTSGESIHNGTATSLADAIPKNGETGSSTKPSPISVSSFDNEAIPEQSSSSSHAPFNNKEVSTHQFANGMKVSSISMPHFHLHDALRGTLRQGLIDRVSFYSIVREINKEALDAALTDPKGVIYNDGTVHGKPRDDGQGDNADDNGVTDDSLKRVNDATAAAVHDTLVKNPTIANGTHQVIAEDGKLHHHPNPQEERESLLVKACLPDEQNAVKSSGVEDNTTDVRSNASKMALPSLGAALLDEEWWLMSAIASRTPEEIALNQSTQLLATFYEAMGEKETSTSATEVNSAIASSRTQLWKPGRSWWEAKSGKNPWVEPVVHNNRWRYLWPLIHYHKFMAKCIKKLKRNGIDVKTSTSDVSLFLREEVCNVSDHLAFMSKYDSEEWTSALSHFDGWTDHASNVEETLRTLVASQQLAGLDETADFQSSLLRSQIDDKILKAIQSAKDDAGKDKYDYKDVPQQHSDKKVEKSKRAVNEDDMNISSQTHPQSAHDISSFGSSIKSGVWANETHLRSAIDNKKRDGSTKISSNTPEYPLRYPYPRQDVYPRHFQHSSYGPQYGPAYGSSLNSSYYHPSDPNQYNSYGQYPPLPIYHMGYHLHGEVLCEDQYGHHNQYADGYYHPVDGSFHDSMAFDRSIHTQDHFIASPMAQTPNRYQGSEMHSAQYPTSPYWSHLNISQLPGISSSPSFHMPPRANYPNRSFRKRNHQHGNQQRKVDSTVDGKAKSLIMFPNQTNSPASRFVMSPQDKKSNPYYAAKNTHARNNERDAPQSSSKLNHSAGPDESFVLPTIEDYSPESPEEKAHSNTSLDLMPPAVKKLYTGSGDDRNKH